MSPELMRMMERIFVVLGGILAIYLGYRLFQIATLKEEGSGKFKAAAVEFTISRVGPGVFFALFGAYVLYTSLKTPVTVSQPAQMVGGLLGAMGFASVGPTDGELKKLEALLDKLPEPEKAEAKKLLASFRSTTRFIGQVPPRPRSDVDG